MTETVDAESITPFCELPIHWQERFADLNRRANVTHEKWVDAQIAYAKLTAKYNELVLASADLLGVDRAEVQPQ